MVHSPTPPTRGEVVPEARISRAAMLAASLRSVSYCFVLLSMMSSFHIMRSKDRGIWPSPGYMS